MVPLQLRGRLLGRQGQVVGQGLRHIVRQGEIDVLEVVLLEKLKVALLVLLRGVLPRCE